MQRVYVIGVGMCKFEKPSKRDFDYPQMSSVATKGALEDAGIPYAEVEHAFVGYCYGDSTCGNRAVYETGLSGIPIVNVNNNCSTGSSALFLARNAVRGGIVQCALALGFEKMERGSLKSHWDDRESPMGQLMGTMVGAAGYEPKAPPAAQIFGNAGKEHQRLYGTKPETFAKIAEKNHFHSQFNPYSQFKQVYSLDQILDSPKVFDPLTKLQCCPTSDGAAAAIVCSEAFVKKHKLEGQAVEIVGMAMATDMKSSYEGSVINVAGGDMTR
jgi:acetyl-CoA acetyltransferase